MALQTFDVAQQGLGTRGLSASGGVTAANPMPLGAPSAAGAGMAPGDAAAMLGLAQALGLLGGQKTPDTVMPANIPRPADKFQVGMQQAPNPSMRASIFGG